MKREEEIIQEANTRYDVNHPFIDIAKESFIEGANWAEKTMFDRACEWLKSMLACGDDYIGDKVVIAYDYETVEEFITAFRRAMKGGAE